jgi:hypothetical protein
VAAARRGTHNLRFNGPAGNATIGSIADTKRFMLVQGLRVRRPNYTTKIQPTHFLNALLLCPAA